jgi:hypothetical protein
MTKRFDSYQKFALLTFFISLFFFMVQDGSERILFVGGIIYSIVVFLHNPIERFLSSRTTNVIQAYGTAVLINGLFIEILAYTSNADAIAAGNLKDVHLFDTTSLLSDLLMSLPYYIAFAFIFAWAVSKYDFTPLSLGLTIFIGQALTVDQFTHFIGLLGGNVPGFLLPGFLMLFTFHAPIILFWLKIQEQYPNRIHSWKKYPITIILQLLPLVMVLATAFIKIVILSIK